MNKKVTGIVAYIAPIGWLIAFLAGDKEGAKYHLNQALVLWIAYIVSAVITSIAGVIPVIGMIVSLIFMVVDIFLLVCWILGLIHACKEEEKELPLIGKIQVLK